jgi:hypothetical protein
MSTIQISVSDALAGRVGKEEIRRLLQEQVQCLEEEMFAAPSPSLSPSPLIPPPMLPLEEDPFIGMWADREEMNDSVEYVRTLRSDFNRLRRWDNREQE